LKEAFQFAKDHKKKSIFRFSDGGVHSHTSHLRGLIDATQDYQLKEVLSMLLQMVGMLIQNREKIFRFRKLHCKYLREIGFNCRAL
jgi:hypothetical protein